MDLTKNKIIYSWSLCFILFLLISPMFFGPLLALSNPEFFEGSGDTDLSLGSTLFIARNLAIGLAFLFAIYFRSASMLFILILVRLITDLIDFPAFQIFRESPIIGQIIIFTALCYLPAFFGLRIFLERNKKTIIISLNVRSPKSIFKKFIASLFNSPESNLKKFDFMPVGSGQVGDCFRVNLDWKKKNNLPSSFIAKCPAADQSSRDTARNLHLYEIETSFYKYLSKKCSARVPELYYTDFDSNSDDGILLLEDMHPAKQIPQMEGCTVKEVSKVLKEAAALHKSYWNDEKLLSYSWLTYGVSEERKEFVANLLPAVYPEWKNRYQGRISEDIFEMGDTLIANYDKYSEVREGPMTLVQGDLRLDNILFTDKNDRAILLDWQTAAVGLPLNDVAYCISTSFLDPNDRASAEEELVKEYHALLEVNDSYSFEQAWNDYRRGSFVGFLMAVMSAMIVERTERGDEMFAVMAERSGWQALHLDAVSFLE